jgi:hypothetical protein
MQMGRKDRVKLVTVSYGLLGNPNKARIQKIMNKWLNKGYRLAERDEVQGGCFKISHTELTFILDE